MDIAINTNGFDNQVIQTENNEICYQNCIKKNDCICFYDLMEKKLW